MNYYKVKYTKEARKFSKKNKLQFIKFHQAFNTIATDRTKVKNYDIKKYHHKKYKDIFRIRLGKYRAIFRIIDSEILVLVLDIDVRGDIYKNTL